jgi:hypothetical protein
MTKNACSSSSSSPFASPSVSFVYFLETQHEQVVLNCKKSGSLLAAFVRVDVDVYVSPLCYDFKAGKPLVTFKHKPKSFHVNVVLPGRVPQPAIDRPPYGLGVEVSLEKLSLCNSRSPVQVKSIAITPVKVKPSSLYKANAMSPSTSQKQHHQYGNLLAATSDYANSDKATSSSSSTPRALAVTPVKDATNNSSRKRQLNEDLDILSPESQAKRQSLHRHCKLQTEDATKEDSARSTRRKNNSAFT